jgi:outer membrane receptor protein involved in Fe transport
VTAATESNSAGIYVFPNVLPGSYLLRVTASGFKAYVAEHLVLYVHQDVSQDVKLTVGAVTTSVKVQAQLPLVQTVSSSVGGLVDTKQIAMMPLGDRTNIYGLLQLAPGVQSSGSQARFGGNSWANGTFASTDGVVSMEMENSRLSDVSPSLDSIAEFKVIDSTGSAESGPGTTAIIIATKEGTNQFHGTAFEYNQVRALQAANFFATSVPKAQFIRNQYGGSVGGPIKRDKAFFFGSYEGFKYRTASTNQGAMPTIALLSGDFSGLSTITDPLTGQPFPNNQIPSTRISSISKAFFPYFSTPNKPTSAAGGLGVNYRVNLVSVHDNNRFQGRVDYNFNTQNIISGRYYIVRQSPYFVAGNTEKFGGVGEGARDDNLAISYTRILSPALVNLATFGWTFESADRIPQNFQLQPSTLVPGIPPSLPGLGGLPIVSITGFTGFTDNAGSGGPFSTYEYGDVLTWIKGTHTVKAGFSWLRWQFVNFQNPPPGHGSFAFTSRYTGNAFADFLLGYLSGSARPVAGLQGSPTNDRFGMFIQDSWKATKRLTLNAGLRYDLASQFENTEGNMANYYPDLNKLVIL